MSVRNHTPAEPTSCPAWVTDPNTTLETLRRFIDRHEHLQGWELVICGVATTLTDVRAELRLRERNSMDAQEC